MQSITFLTIGNNMELVPKPMPSGLQHFLDNVDNFCVPNSDNMMIQWSKAGVGFGEVHFSFNKETGFFHCDSEGMSKSFVKEMLNKMVDDSVFD